MFLDSISNSLFKPLASQNSAFYGAGLHALHKRLIAHNAGGDECTPKEARELIRHELYNRAQLAQWENESDDGADIGADPAGRIYQRLRDTGWIIEVDEIGYRQVASFSPMAAQLLNALYTLANPEKLDIGSVCGGVHSLLRAVAESPRKNARQITFAAKNARSFYSEASALSFTTRGIAHQMLNQSDSAEQLNTFYNVFIKDVFARDYRTLHSNDNPFKYRARILSLAARISFDNEILQEVVAGMVSRDQDETAEQVKEEIRRDLEAISNVFTNLPKLMEVMERYRRSMTTRVQEAIRYSYRATPDIGRRITALIGQVATTNEADFPSNLLDDTYITQSRLYEKPVKKGFSEATPIQKSPPPLAQIAYDRAMKDYMKRRMPNPSRLKAYLERTMGDRREITTCDMAIGSLDDLLAYLELRKMLAGSHIRDGAYASLTRSYKVVLNNDVITVNNYVESPQLKISRV